MRKAAILLLVVAYVINTVKAFGGIGGGGNVGVGVTKGGVGGHVGVGGHGVGGHIGVTGPGVGGHIGVTGAGSVNGHVGVDFGCGGIHASGHAGGSAGATGAPNGHAHAHVGFGHGCKTGATGANAAEASTPPMEETTKAEETTTPAPETTTPAPETTTPPPPETTTEGESCNKTGCEEECDKKGYLKNKAACKPSKMGHKCTCGGTSCIQDECWKKCTGEEWQKGYCKTHSVGRQCHCFGCRKDDCWNQCQKKKNKGYCKPKGKQPENGPKNLQCICFG